MAIILKNKTQLSIVVYSYNPSTEEEGSWNKDQLGLQSETQFQNKQASKQTPKQVLVGMGSNWSLCVLLVGVQNGTAAVENSLAFLWKLNIDIPYDLAVLLLGMYSQMPESREPNKNRPAMFTAVLLTTIKRERIQMFISRRMDQKIVVCPSNKILVSTKRSKCWWVRQHE
jgi:hypothetical protein